MKVQSVFVGPERKADIEEEPLGKIVPLPEWMVKKLAPKLDGTGIVYLNGQSGNGKQLLLKARQYQSKSSGFVRH